jgi:hypothetical protein
MKCEDLFKKFIFSVTCISNLETDSMKVKMKNCSYDIRSDSLLIIVWVISQFTAYYHMSSLNSYES